MLQWLKLFLTYHESDSSDLITILFANKAKKQNDARVRKM